MQRSQAEDLKGLKTVKENLALEVVLCYFIPMKLSEWAKRQGVTYKAAWNWFHAGILPVRARPWPTGTLLGEEENNTMSQTVIYARVSSHDQKTDLDRPVARLVS